MAPKARRKNKRGKKSRTEQSRSDFANKPFARIKSNLAPNDDHGRGNRAKKQASSPTESSKQSHDDEDMFVSAMAGVSPLAGRKKSLPPEPSMPKRPSAMEQEEQEVIDELRKLVDGRSWLSIHETDEAIEGLADGVDPSLLARLKSGEFSIQDHLDLHGLSRQEARPKVEAFLSRSLGHGMRCVLIIHGRGLRSKDHRPVLKPALKNWFNRSGLRKSILAFCTARVCDGGTGAIYVLLKKNRRP